MTISSTFEGTNQLPGVVRLHLSGVGATSSDMTSVKGCTSIVHTATGLYTVTLKKPYKGGLVGFSAAVVTSATAANFDVVLTDISTVATTGVFKIACLSISSGNAVAGTIADMLTTDTLLMTVDVQDTAAKPAGRV